MAITSGLHSTWRKFQSCAAGNTAIPRGGEEELLISLDAEDKVSCGCRQKDSMVQGWLVLNVIHARRQRNGCLVVLPHSTKEVITDVLRFLFGADNTTCLTCAMLVRLLA